MITQVLCDTDCKFMSILQVILHYPVFRLRLGFYRKTFMKKKRIVTSSSAVHNVSFQEASKNIMKLLMWSEAVYGSESWRRNN